MLLRDYDPEDDEDDEDEDIEVEPDDPDNWVDEAEDKETTDNERADFEEWPVI